MAEITRAEYDASFGPTTGDRIRLADINLFIEVEEDRCVGGDEFCLGGVDTNLVQTRPTGSSRSPSGRPLSGRR